MIPRHLALELRRRLDQFPAVALLGPLQIEQRWLVTPDSGAPAYRTDGVEVIGLTDLLRRWRSA